MPRLFSPDSFWNQPIAPDVRTDPRNEQVVAMLDSDPAGAMHVNCREFTIPVYAVDDSTPRRIVAQATRDEQTLRRQGKWSPFDKQWSQAPDFGPEIPIPDGAQPDPASDAHMALIDAQNRTVWDMWGASVDENGQWHAKTGMVYPLDGQGAFDPARFDIANGESIHSYGPGRAAGVPIIAGLIFLDEVQAGRIEHKLAYATRFGAYQEHTWPATWTDGQVIGGLPEGAVLQLDPSLDLSQFDLSPAAGTIARALQEFGCVNVDMAGGNCVYAEGLYGKPGPRWEEILDPHELKRIPMTHYRVVEMGPIIPRGDGRRGPTRGGWL